MRACAALAADTKHTSEGKRVCVCMRVRVLSSKGSTHLDMDALTVSAVG